MPSMTPRTQSVVQSAHHRSLAESIMIVMNCVTKRKDFILDLRTRTGQRSSRRFAHNGGARGFRFGRIYFSRSALVWPGTLQSSEVWIRPGSEGPASDGSAFEASEGFGEGWSAVVERVEEAMGAATGALEWVVEVRVVVRAAEAAVAEDSVAAAREEEASAAARATVERAAVKRVAAERAAGR
eukprot:3177743-Prymnesium_polylepis.1